MSATLDAFISALDNHIRRVQKSNELVTDTLEQRRELRDLIDRYIDERIDAKLKHQDFGKLP
jgi:hypothetical protein